MTRSRIWVLAAVAILVAAFFAFDLERFLTLDVAQGAAGPIAAYRDAHPWLSAAVPTSRVYVAVTGLSLPGASGADAGRRRDLRPGLGNAARVLRLVARRHAGVPGGALPVPRLPSRRASASGSRRSTPASRRRARSTCSRCAWCRCSRSSSSTWRWGSRAARAHVLLGQPARHAGGHDRLRERGHELAKIDSLSGILSPGLVVSFALLGIFPLLAKKIVERIKSRQAYARWPKPAKFDRNLVVIGAGSAGLVTAYIAAAVKAKVTLVEKHKMGGDCLNTGCVPSKALIRSAKLLSHIKRAKEFGIREASAQFDFAEVMERVQRVIATVEPHDSAERYTGLGVECIAGEARIASPYAVEIKTADGVKTLTTRAIVIAAGARPFVPPIPGIEEVGYLTSDTVWTLRAAAQAAGGARRRADRLRARAVLCALRLEGHASRDAAAHPAARGPGDLGDGDAALPRRRASPCSPATQAKRFVVENGEKVLIAEHEGREVRIAVRRLARAPWAASPTPRATDSRNSGIATTQARTVETNDYLQTHLPQHLRLRRRRRAVPVHAHRAAPGLVRGGQRAVRTLQEVPRRLLGHPLGDLHRSRSRARRPERDRGEGEEDRLRGHALRHRRPRPRHRRRARRTASSRC